MVDLARTAKILLSDDELDDYDASEKLPLELERKRSRDCTQVPLPCQQIKKKKTSARASESGSDYSVQQRHVSLQSLLPLPLSPSSCGSVNDSMKGSETASLASTTTTTTTTTTCRATCRSAGCMQSGERQLFSPMTQEEKIRKETGIQVKNPNRATKAVVKLTSMQKMTAEYVALSEKYNALWTNHDNYIRKERMKNMRKIAWLKNCLSQIAEKWIAGGGEMESILAFMDHKVPQSFRI